MKRWWVIFICLNQFFISYGQVAGYFLGPEEYSFVNYSQNKISFPGDSTHFDKLYAKIDSLVLYGNGKINIVHIGGSHIQADIYTHQIRKNLQSLQHDMDGGRGLIFPFRMAHTNNPSNYKINYTGTWEYCKNTSYKRDCPLGLTGMSVTTTNNRASISVNPNGDSETNYVFDKVKVFHNLSSYKIYIDDNNTHIYGEYDTLGGYTIFEVPESKTLSLKISKTDSLSNKFILYGITLENNNPGIVYHSIGVNGSRLKSFINCEYYSQQIGSLNPDLIIFSIGTNDGNTKHFNTNLYKNEYIQLIEISKMACPNAAILITVPNDCYYYKRYANENTALIQEEILSIAKEYNYAVWDFYSIMGGLNSSLTWYNYGLMRFDRIHFNKKGYLIKGNLFTEALVDGWESHLPDRLINYTFFNTPDTITKISQIKPE